MFKNLRSLTIVVSIFLTAILSPAVMAGEPETGAANDFHIFTRTAANRFHSTSTATTDKIVKFANDAGTAFSDSIMTEAAGVIGISTASPNSASRLDVNGIIRGEDRIDSRKAGSNTAGSGPGFFAGTTGGDYVGFQMSASNEMDFWVWNPAISNFTRSMSIRNNGSIGMGTTTPGEGLAATQEAPLHIYSAQDKNTYLLVQNAANGLNASATVRTTADVANLNISSHATGRTVSRFGVTVGGWDEILAWTGNGLIVGTSVTKPLIFGTSAVARMTIDSAGNVTIGNPGDNVNTTINGTLTATKVFNAVYQDIAEWVPATTHMEPGTVVVLNRQRSNEVMPSAHAYDTAVAGVVSAQPGVVLGVASDSKAQIATTGRVKVHVDATAGAIAIGDLLVTSEKSGTAMKSQAVDLGGVQFHRPGTVIGKALEPLPDGQGDILVLLSLQ